MWDWKKVRGILKMHVFSQFEKFSETESETYCGPPIGIPIFSPRNRKNAKNFYCLQLLSRRVYDGITLIPNNVLALKTDVTSIGVCIAYKVINPCILTVEMYN